MKIEEIIEEATYVAAIDLLERVVAMLTKMIDP